MRRKDRYVALGTLAVLVGGGAAFFVPLLTQRSEPPRARPAVTVPVDIERDATDVAVVVPVAIAGKPYHFLLDTGASTTAVNGTVLKAVRAEDTGKDQDYQDASGDVQPSRMFRVHAWSIDGLPLEEDALVSNLAHPLDVDGLLGSDQLARFGRVTIDYDRHVLIITPRDRLG